MHYFAVLLNGDFSFARLAIIIWSSEHSSKNLPFPSKGFEVVNISETVMLQQKCKIRLL